MRPITDEALHDLLERDRDRGWRTFIEVYTPTLVGLIEGLGLRDRDEAMDLYTRVCERLAERDCARLRRHDPAQGPLGAWLSVVVRHAAVDWVRSRAGRRRLFRVVAGLDPFCQRVFQLYYWHDRSPSEIAGELSSAAGEPVTLLDVLGALDIVHARLSARHYAELVSMTARSAPPVSLEAELAGARIDPRDPAPAPDAALEKREADAALDAALALLPSEDAAIFRLHYLQGLSIADVRRALHLPSLSRARLSTIVTALQSRLSLAVPPAAQATTGGRP